MLLLSLKFEPPGYKIAQTGSKLKKSPTLELLILICESRVHKRPLKEIKTLEIFLFTKNSTEWISMFQGNSFMPH
jgi:hypothetical protein